MVKMNTVLTPTNMILTHTKNKLLTETVNF